MAASLPITGFLHLVGTAEKEKIGLILASKA